MLQDALDLLDRDLELVLEVRILGDEVDRAGLHRRDRVVDRAVAGQDDDRQVGERAAAARGRSRSRCAVPVPRSRSRTTRSASLRARARYDRVLAVVEADDVAAARRGTRRQEPPHLGLIVDATIGRCRSGHGCFARSLMLGPAPSAERQRETRPGRSAGSRDRRAAALLAVDGDAAVVRRDHALGDREPDAGAGLLGREAGREQARQVGRRDARPGVGDLDLDDRRAARGDRAGGDRRPGRPPIADPTFRRAVADYLVHERRHVQAEATELAAMAPFRKDAAPTGGEHG